MDTPFALRCIDESYRAGVLDAMDRIGKRARQHEVGGDLVALEVDIRVWRSVQEAAFFGRDAAHAAYRGEQM